MCNYPIKTQHQRNILLYLISIGSIVLAFLYFQVSIRLLVSKVGSFYTSPTQAGIVSLVIFIILLAGAILSMIGIRKRSLCLKSFLFYALLFGMLLSFGMILPNYDFSFGNVFNFDITNGSKPLDQIAAVEAIAATRFCNTVCPCNFSQKQFASVPKTDPQGPIKFQDCSTSGVFIDKFQAAAQILGYLQDKYGCTGFASVKDYFMFSDVNKEPIKVKCGDYFSLELNQLVFSSGGEFFLGLLLSLTMLIGYCVLGKSYKDSKELDPAINQIIPSSA